MSPLPPAEYNGDDARESLPSKSPRKSTLTHPRHPENPLAAINLPSVILSALHGQVPHLPTPLLPRTSSNLLLYASLQDWFVLNEHSARRGTDLFQNASPKKNLHILTNHDDAVWFLGPRRPGSSEGINDAPGKKDGMSLEGMQNYRIVSKDVLELGKAMNVDFVQSIHEGPSLGNSWFGSSADVGFENYNNDTSIRRSRKRIRKAGEKCLKLGKDFVSSVKRMEWSKGRGFLSIGGGDDVEERRRCAQDVLHVVREHPGANLIGFVIAGLYAGETPHDRWACIDAVVQVLTESEFDSKLRILAGGNGAPEEVVKAVRHGIDLVEGSYPSDCADAGWVLDLKTGRKRNVRDKNWLLDKTPPVSRCQCWVCNGSSNRKGFTRAYIRHLFEVHEMLGPILLTAHNIHVYLSWVEDLQVAVRDSRFDAFELHFRNTRKQLRQEPHLFENGVAEDSGLDRGAPASSPW